MPRSPVAFVLGGVASTGAAEVGMLRALLEQGITPDLILGTSVGAINGAALARNPDLEGARRLARLWEELTVEGSSAARSSHAPPPWSRPRTHLHPHGPMRTMMREEFGSARIEDLAVPFQCVAASIERAREHWFISRPARGRRAGELCSAGPAACGPDRRRALPRRRPGRQHPCRPGPGSRREDRLRAPGRAGRDAVACPEATMGGGDDLLRDRARASLLDHDGAAPGGRVGACAADRRHVGVQRPTAVPLSRLLRRSHPDRCGVHRQPGLPP